MCSVIASCLSAASSKQSRHNTILIWVLISVVLNVLLLPKTTEGASLKRREAVDENLDSSSDNEVDPGYIYMSCMAPVECRDTCINFYAGSLHDDYDCTQVFENMNFIFYCKCHIDASLTEDHHIEDENEMPFYR